MELKIREAKDFPTDSAEGKKVRLKIPAYESELSKLKATLTATQKSLKTEVGLRENEMATLTALKTELEVAERTMRKLGLQFSNGEVGGFCYTFEPAVMKLKLQKFF